MLRIFGFGYFTLLFSIHALAEDVKVDFSGFATIAATYNSNQQLAFRSSFLNNGHTGLSMGSDSKFGLQTNIRLSDKWDSVVQAVYQDRSNTDIESFVELAFLRYRTNRNWAIRVGRLNSDLYLISEYPSVGYAYVWIRPPNEFYSFAGSVAHFDGLDIEYSNRIGKGFLQVKLAGGESEPKLKEELGNFSFKFEKLVTLSMSYVRDSLTLRASHSRSNLSAFSSDNFLRLLTGLDVIPPTLWPDAKSISSGLNSENKLMHFSAIGTSYDYGRWSIQSELSSATTDWLIYQPTLSAYISMGYTLANTTYYLSLSGAKNRKPFVYFDNPQLPTFIPENTRNAVTQLYDQAIAVIDGASVRQHSFSIGMKHYLSDNLAAKLQMDHTNIDPMGGGLWDTQNPDVIYTKQNVTTMSIGLSMVF